MGSALDELSMVASTIVGATVEFYKQPVPQELKASLSEFLIAALDQMAASVSLINGRLPLDSTEEALQEVARCATDCKQCTCVWQELTKHLITHARRSLALI